MHVIAPVRSFRGMARLADEVPPEGRVRLSTHLAGRLIHSAAEAGMAVTVVTADHQVSVWARQRGLGLIVDPGGGLNQAAAAAIESLDVWAVVHADLPMITASDLDVIRRSLDRGTVLSPSHDGGTNVIAAATPTFPFRYGTGSFRKHLAVLGGRARIVLRPGLAFDIDRPGDLAVARRLGALP